MLTQTVKEDLSSPGVRDEESWEKWAGKQVAASSSSAKLKFTTRKTAKQIPRSPRKNVKETKMKELSKGISNLTPSIANLQRKRYASQSGLDFGSSRPLRSSSSGSEPLKVRRGLRVWCRRDGVEGQEFRYDDGEDFGDEEEGLLLFSGVYYEGESVLTR